MTIHDNTRLADVLDMISRSASVSGGIRAACKTSASEMRKLQAAYEALGGEVSYPTGEDDTGRLQEMLAELEAHPAVPLTVDEELKVREPTSLSTVEFLRDGRGDA